MSIFGLKENTPFDMIRQFAVHLNAELEEEYQAAKLILDNDKGQGTIALYEPFEGLTAWVYNLVFHEDFEIDLEFASDGLFYFGYVVNGYQLQRFNRQDKYEKLNQGQNFIMVSEEGMQADFLIPGQTIFKCCYLIMEPSILRKSKGPIKRRLADIMKDRSAEKPYRHFGEIDLQTGRFAEIIVNNNRTDIAGKLLIEGAISSMLATQMDAYDIDRKSKMDNLFLSSSELARTSKLGDYVRNHIKQKLNLPQICKALNVSPKKLQQGVQLLYGCSVAQYVQNFRLEMSKELIHGTDLKISEISGKVGISSKSYFSRIFKERFGILPRNYMSSFSKADIFFEVSYRSMARRDITKKDVEELILLSRERNKKFGVTGCLIYHENIFFQIMEGPKKSVLRLYENIKQDNRHFDVLTIHQGTKLFRDFADWNMALFSEEHLLNISYQGNTEQLDLNHIMLDIEGQTLLSKNLWRKVLLQIKVRK